MEPRAIRGYWTAKWSRHDFYVTRWHQVVVVMVIIDA